MLPDIVIIIIDRFFWSYKILIFIRIILTWISVHPRGHAKTIFDFISDLTDPWLDLFRRFVPVVDFGGMGIDLSPIIAIFVLELLHSAVLNLLRSL